MAAPGPAARLLVLRRGAIRARRRWEWAIGEAERIFASAESKRMEMLKADEALQRELKARKDLILIDDLCSDSTLVVAEEE